MKLVEALFCFHKCFEHTEPVDTCQEVTARCCGKVFTWDVGMSVLFTTQLLIFAAFKNSGFMLEASADSYPQGKQSVL